MKPKTAQAEQEFLLSNVEMASDGFVMEVNVIKKEDTEVDDTHNRLEESLDIRTDIKSESVEDILKCNLSHESLQQDVRAVECEIKNEEMHISYPVCFEKDVDLKVSSLLDTEIATKVCPGNSGGRDYIKSENLEEIFKCNVVKHETLDLFEMPQNFTTAVKYETNSEEIDMTYPSVCFKKDVDLKPSILPDAGTAVKGCSGNSCDRDFRERELKEQWQQVHVNQLNTEASNFKSNMTQEVKNISFSCFSCNYSTNLKSNLVDHMLLHGKRNNKTFTCRNCNYSTKYNHSLVLHKLVHNKEKGTILSCKTQSKKSFRHHMLDYEKKLSCKYCERQFKLKLSLDDHVLRNHQDNIDLVSSKIHNCLTCDYKTTVKTNLRYHIMKVHSGNYEKHFCKRCEKHFKSKISLDDHILKNHVDIIDQVTTKVHNCPTCDYKTTIKPHLRYHIMKVHSGNYEEHSCKRCEKHYKSKKALDDHILKKHVDIIDQVTRKVHNCPTCDYKTTGSSQLKKHLRRHSGNHEKFFCKRCKKHFKSKTALDDHILKKHVDIIDQVTNKVHSCPTCDYKTTIKALLKYHIKVHTGSYKKYSCSCCERYLKSKRALDEHIVKHHKNFTDLVSNKVHSCSACDFKTTLITRFRRHVMMHSGSCERHPCIGCERYFKEKMSLDDHIIKHHPHLIESVESTVYSCQKCDYKTTRKTLLLRYHMLKVHSEKNEEHSCICCEKKFKHKNSLDYHIEKNHQDMVDSVRRKIHICPTCDYKTTIKTLLTNHMVKAHSDVP